MTATRARLPDAGEAGSRRRRFRLTSCSSIWNFARCFALAPVIKELRLVKPYVNLVRNDGPQIQLSGPDRRIHVRAIRADAAFRPEQYSNQRRQDRLRRPPGADQTLDHVAQDRRAVYFQLADLCRYQGQTGIFRGDQRRALSSRRRYHHAVQGLSRKHAWASTSTNWRSPSTSNIRRWR